MINLIDELRKIIDGLDEEILKILSKRRHLVKEIAKLKDELNIPIFDKKREEEILNNLSKKAKELGLDPDSISRIFSSIFQASRNNQQGKMKKPECDIKQIGLMGFGRFGRLIVNHLKDFEFHVFDSKKIEAKENNMVLSSLNEACSQDIVILAVPISEIESTLKKIKNLVKKDSVIIDVCSVKEHPVKLMKSILPKHVQILATHPMFGPDTASESLEGRKIVLCKVRIKEGMYCQIKKFLESKKLDIIETTPENHDREIAKSLALTQLIGRALNEMKLSALDIDTKGYRELMSIKDIAKNDTWQLFEDMNKFNRYSKEVRKKLASSLNIIEKKLKKNENSIPGNKRSIQ
ncbi:prephenate dehydrogenase/arogenate dehydrogenase family protein [Candidatus Woesearchaeota archaeon]|nr:prephenate dehydrogenase/arogenate dehydrogenase family protein [Candidatus Woesearchaeota archaeon]